MRTIVFDIETDGFLDELSLMSVAWTYNIEDEEYKEWREQDVHKLVSYLNSSDLVVAHNGIGFDCLALEKLTGTEIKVPVFDTLVRSRLGNPDRRGGHSLKAWGIRLGILKGSVKDDEDDEAQVFGVYTKELSDYCKQDVAVTVALYDRLKTDVDWEPINWDDWRV